MIDGKPIAQILHERMGLIKELYDKCDNEYDRLEVLLSKRLLSPEPGLEALIAKATEARDATTRDLDREINDLGYMIFTGCNLREIVILDASIFDKLKQVAARGSVCIDNAEFYLMDE